MQKAILKNGVPHFVNEDGSLTKVTPSEVVTTLRRMRGAQVARYCNKCAEPSCDIVEGREYTLTNFESEYVDEYFEYTVRDTANPYKIISTTKARVASLL